MATERQVMEELEHYGNKKDKIYKLLATSRQYSSTS